MLPLRAVSAFVLFLVAVPVVAHDSLIAAGSLGGTAAEDHAVLAGERLSVADAVAPSPFAAMDLGADAYTEIDAAALPDLNGDSKAEIAVLGKQPDGKASVRILDVARGTVIQGFTLSSDAVYGGLDAVLDSDGQGAPLLAIWFFDAQGVVKVQLRTLAGGKLRTIAFGKQWHRVDSAVLQQGPASRLVMLARRRSDGLNRVFSADLSGTVGPNWSLNARWMPFALRPAAEWNGAATPVVAVLAQARDSNLVKVQVKRLADGADLGSLGYGSERQPRAFVQLPQPGRTPLYAVLLQNATDARVVVHSLSGDPPKSAFKLDAAAQWIDAVALTDADGTGSPGVAALARSPDGNLTTSTFRLDGSMVGEVAFGVPPVIAEPLLVELRPQQDATLHEAAAEPGTANGSGEHFFVGISGQGVMARGLLQFDVASALPRGSRIVGTELQTFMSRSRNPAMNVDLRRLYASWSEGPSNPGGEEGEGAPAEAGDTTWFFRRNPDLRWETPGGDASPVARGGATIVAGFNTYPSTPELVEDVQRWLDVPADSKGWLALPDADPANTTQAMRFDSRSNPVESQRPLLRVWYRPPE